MNEFQEFQEFLYRFNIKTGILIEAVLSSQIERFKIIDNKEDGSAIGNDNNGGSKLATKFEMLPLPNDITTIPPPHGLHLAKYIEHSRTFDKHTGQTVIEGEWIEAGEPPKPTEEELLKKELIEIESILRERHFQDWLASQSSIKDIEMAFMSNYQEEYEQYNTESELLQTNTSDLIKRYIEITKKLQKKKGSEKIVRTRR